MIDLIEKGLSRYGDMELYLRELYNFAADFCDSAAKLETAAAQMDSDEAHAIAHNLKSASGNLAVTEVFNTAGELNDLFGRKKLQEADALIPALTQSLSSVIQSIKQFQISQEKPVPEKKETDADEVRSLLKKLKDALGAYKFDTVEELIQSLETYLDASDLSALSKTIEAYDYDGAFLEIQTIMNKLN